MKSIIERVYEILSARDIDAIITSDGYNMRYVSGYSGATGFMYITRRRKVIITDSRYTVAAKEEAPDFEVVQISTEKNYKQILEEFVKSESINRAGFEDKSVSYGEYKLLSGLKEDMELVELGDDLNHLRVIKTPTEIDNIAMAEHIGDVAFKKILDYIKPGMTELQVAAMLEFYMKEEGAEGLSFDTIVASGINSFKPHAVPGRKKIETGDFVTMDFGCIYNGYCSDMTRTIVMGKADAKQKEIYSTVLNAQLSALDMIKEGVKCAEVDKVARSIIGDAGYGDCFGHGLGHSVGLYIHESPSLSSACKETLAVGMLETVEPGIYVEGFGGVRIEDLVVVTPEGYRNLTESPKELIEL
ncbi:MAG: aminopeptidase P family protein [Lachnospiraceae bacterium]|nr:aminopeptidase P family protein [Lachnospiraceae bacterium]